jgi:hypothetical protein
MACEFQREEGGEWERGILIDNGKLILDKDSEPVPVGKLYDYRKKASLLSIDVTYIFNV